MICIVLYRYFRMLNETMLPQFYLTYYKICVMNMKKKSHSQIMLVNKKILVF